MTQESQLELEAGSSESSPPSQSESSAQPCQTLTLDIRDLHQRFSVTVKRRPAGGPAPRRLEREARRGGTQAALPCSNGKAFRAWMAPPGPSPRPLRLLLLA
jgi:hypothetical protein